MPSAIAESFRRITLKRTDRPRPRDRRAKLRELAAGTAGEADPIRIKALFEGHHELLNEAPAKYADIDFKPPKGVQQAAKRGLGLRQKHGKGGLGTKEAGKKGIGSGIARASSLSAGEAQSPDTISMMVGFFGRHAAYKDHHDDESSPAYISWMLWGGDPGEAWAKKVLGQMRAADKKKEESFRPTSLSDASPALLGWRRRSNADRIEALLRASPSISEWMNRHTNTSRTGPAAPPAELRPELELKQNQGFEEASSAPGSRSLNRVEALQAELSEVFGGLDFSASLSQDAGGGVTEALPGSGPPDKKAKDKKTPEEKRQQKDVEAAKNLWKQYKQRKR